MDNSPNIILTGNAMSNQQLYKSMCRGRMSFMYMCPKGKNTKKRYISEILEQYKGKLHTEELGLEVIFFFGTRHKRDCDNYSKLVLDAMEGIVYEDDKLVKPLLINKFYDKENPRIEIRFVKDYKANYEKQ